ncbi:acyltransferase family protein [Micromonospora taraxaci]|uniref:acyltransferase family protein n=1 Tax=Micromonospora taraxaci TaxID=1316803 RepID=UPI00119F308A|nr:acyltransferase [Micromonospora taraxaci]
MSSSTANRYSPPSNRESAETEESVVREAPGRSSQDRKPRLYVVDLLRFGAAGLVLSYHLFRLDIWNAVESSAGNPWLQALGKVSDYGWMGVELFFMISGFVICMSSWGRCLGDFFISRTTRLLPAYVFAVLLTAALLFTFRDGGGNEPPLTTVLGNLTMIQGLLGIPLLDHSYWTLMVELMFYLCFAVLVFFGLTYKRVLAFCILYTAISLIAQASKEDFLIVLTRPDYTSFFVFGVILYLMYQFGSSLLLTGILTGSGILCAISLSHHVDEHIAVGERVNFAMALPIMCGFFVVMIAVAKGWLNWIQAPVLVTVGALTYPLYLLHQTNGHIVIRLFRDDVPAWLLLTCLVSGLLVLSYGIHALIEKPVGSAMRRSLRANFAQIRAAEPKSVESPR